MEKVLEECGIRVEFMSESMKRALILLGYVIDKDFGKLVQKKIPNIPLSTQKKIEQIGDHISPELWVEVAFDSMTLSSLSSAESPSNEHLQTFVDLFTPETSLAERYLIYLITYSKREAKTIRELSGLRPPRAVIKKIQAYYNRQKEYDKGAIQFIFFSLAAENKIK